MTAVRRQISRHAAQLRRDRTDAEHRVWQRLRNRQIGGLKWRFQHSIGSRVADFVCIEAMLIVEIDGGQHSEDADRRRTQELQAHGYAVLRFWNSEVFENMDGVLEVILAAAQRRVAEEGRPSPNPLPQAGEGQEGRPSPNPLPQAGEGQERRPSPNPLPQAGEGQEGRPSLDPLPQAGEG